MLKLQSQEYEFLFKFPLNNAVSALPVNLLEMLIFFPFPLAQF